jgi:hypothetical protein
VVNSPRCKFTNFLSQFYFPRSQHSTVPSGLALLLSHPTSLSALT